MNQFEAKILEQVNLLQQAAEKTQEVIIEHNKCFEMLKETMTHLADSNTELRGRVADLEARVAYFTNDQPQIIQPRH